jgi:hypothetical protein
MGERTHTAEELAISANLIDTVSSELDWSDDVREAETTADAIAALAVGCMRRMQDNRHRGDFRADPHGSLGERMIALRNAAERLICLAADAGMPVPPAGTAEAAAKQAADVANWAWLLARSVAEAIERRARG